MYVQPHQTLINKKSFKVAFTIGVLLALISTILRGIVLYSTTNYSDVVATFQWIFTVLSLLDFIVLIVIAQKHRSSMRRQALAPPIQIAPNQNLIFTDQRPQLPNNNLNNGYLRAPLGQQNQRNHRNLGNRNIPDAQYMIIQDQIRGRPDDINRTIASQN